MAVAAGAANGDRRLGSFVLQNEVEINNRHFFSKIYCFPRYALENYFDDSEQG